MIKKTITFGFLVSIFILSACAVKKDSSTKTFKLIKAEQAYFTLGMKRPDGKTSGVSYSMYFKKKGDIKVEKVWIKGTNIDFEQVKTSDNAIRVKSTFYKNNDSNIHKDVKVPIEFEGKALLQYSEDGETKYFIIKEFKIFKASLAK